MNPIREYSDKLIAALLADSRVQALIAKDPGTAVRLTNAVKTMAPLLILTRTDVDRAAAELLEQLTERLRAEPHLLAPASPDYEETEVRFGSVVMIMAGNARVMAYIQEVLTHLHSDSRFSKVVRVTTPELAVHNAIGHAVALWNHGTKDPKAVADIIATEASEALERHLLEQAPVEVYH